jgi:hypothetical protein
MQFTDCKWTTISSRQAFTKSLFLNRNMASIENYFKIENCF